MRPLVLTALTFLGICLTVAVLFLGFLWWKQESIVFQPPRLAELGASTEARRVDYRAEDGQPLYGYLVGDSAAATPGSGGGGGALVVAFHGNADLAHWQIPWARELVRRAARRSGGSSAGGSGAGGVHVLLAEYRGYGGLSGSPTYEGSRLDARAAYAFARDSLGVRPADVVLYGHSLGSAVAADLAATLSARGEAPRALLLQSPFTSARAMTRIMFAPPVDFAWGVISRVHFDSDRAVRSLPCPVWVAHGERDMFIPAGMGRALHAAARVKGDLLVVPGAGHNDVAAVGGDEYWEWLVSGAGR